MTQQYQVARGDYLRAGEASADIKRRLKQLGLQSDLLRRVAVASYEMEMNLVIHSLGGTMGLDVQPDMVRLLSCDAGPGISDVALAMREGFSTADEEARNLGFGAGMGLPNIKRNADRFVIQSQPGCGTRIETQFNIVHEDRHA